MNKQNHHLNLAILLMAGLVIAGCQEDEVGGFTPAAPGDAIEFAVNAVKTRTAYVSDNQIDWTGGEKIRIYSDVADKKGQSDNILTSGTVGGWTNNALYTVTPVTGDGEHQYHGEFTATNGEYLAWSALSDTHEFYGIYPDERLNIEGSTPSNGLFQLQFISNQACKVTSAENGSYIAAPDMLNAYMVAHNRVVRTENHVLLDFDPIMTTLDITIKAGGYEVATGIIQPLTVTGVSVTLPVVLGKDYFTYNATNIQNSNEEGSQGQGELQEELGEGSESVFISFTDKSGNPMNISLSEGDSIKLTAFLPPIPNDKTTGTKIRVWTAENFNFQTTLKNQLQAQYKIEIPLPDVKPDSPKNTNWISELDGNIYLRQLSIPGAYCEDTKDDQANAAAIKKMLDMGVRAFDVREIDFPHKFHHDVSDAVCQTFKEFLNQNPQEFIIVYSDQNVGDCFDDKDVQIPIYKLTPDNASSTTITDLQGKIVPLIEIDPLIERGKYFCTYDDIISQKIFPVHDCSSSNFQLDPEGWNKWDEDGAVSNWGGQNLTNSSDKEAINDPINQYKKQRGYTGIVTLHDIEYSDDMVNVVDEQLIQTIINCNFKFILDRKTN